MILLFVVLLVLPQDRLRGAVAYRTRERFSMPSMTDACVGAVAFVVCDLPAVADHGRRRRCSR